MITGEAAVEEEATYRAACSPFEVSYAECGVPVTSQGFTNTEST